MLLVKVLSLDFKSGMGFATSGEGQVGHLAL